MKSRGEAFALVGFREIKVIDQRVLKIIFERMVR